MTAKTTETKGQKLIKIPNRDHYYFDEKSRIIYFVRKVEGKLIKFSTEVLYDESPSSILKASRVVSKKENEKKEAKKKKELTNQKLMSEHLDDFLVRSEKAGDKPSTLISKKRSVEILKKYLGNHLPSELVSTLEQEHDPEYKTEWLKFFDAFQAENPGYVMSNITKHFNSVCIYLHNIGVLSKKPNIFNPNEQKENIKRRKKKHRIYTADEILLMDAVCNDDQRLALWLGYDMAFRLDDCVKLTWSRIHLDKKSPYIEFHGDENKTKAVIKVPISDSSAALLRARKETSTSDWVFPLQTDPTRPMLPQALFFEYVVRQSGVNYGSHHLLRHTRLTEDFGNKELPDSLVMKIRRISLKVALEHYIHPSDDDMEKFRNTGKVKRK